MAGNRFSTIVYIIIGLAAIGLVAQLFKDAIGFFTGILITLVGAVLIFAIIYMLFIKNRTSSTRNSEMRKYKQAVKQSKAKYSNHQKPRVNSNQQKRQNQLIKKKNQIQKSHLRVIDGNKSKRKKRASN